LLPVSQAKSDSGRELVILAAASLGNTRLLDNVEVSLD
jgi:pantothenate synthetase